MPKDAYIRLRYSKHKKYHQIKKMRRKNLEGVLDDISKSEKNQKIT